jgi:hypothetical protein
MNREVIEQAFVQWFAESYPNVKPATHSVMSHVAFAEHIIQQLREQKTNELGGTGLP